MTDTDGHSDARSRLLGQRDHLLGCVQRLQRALVDISRRLPDEGDDDRDDRRG